MGLFRKAADGGEGLALTKLGFMYEHGRGGLPKDEVKAVELFGCGARSHAKALLPSSSASSKIVCKTPR
ncbi:MAG: hypothetical protein ACJ746_26105 [Bryobacteraceae bacterium]